MKKLPKHILKKYVAIWLELVIILLKLVQNVMAKTDLSVFMNESTLKDFLEVWEHYMNEIRNLPLKRAHFVKKKWNTSQYNMW